MSDAKDTTQTEQTQNIVAPSDAGSGFDWWRRTLQYKTGLGLSESEKLKYESESEWRNKIKETERRLSKEQKQCNSCNEWKDFMIDHSPSVVFMMNQIRRVNRDIEPEKKVFCGVCTEPKYAGYHPDLGIQICQNYLTDKWQLEEALTHELIHLYDDNRFKVDWFNLRHYACSEIRAASLSGECKMMNEFQKVNGSRRMAKGHQSCVKRLAFLGVKNHPKCRDDDEAKRIVDEVFRSCFNDTRPYEMIYK